MDSLLPDLPVPPRRFEVTVTFRRPEAATGAMPDGHGELAALAAVAACADRLLTAWTASQAVVSMILEANSTADALTAGAEVAKALGCGRQAASVTAEPVASLPRGHGERHPGAAQPIGW